MDRPAALLMLILTLGHNILGGDILLPSVQPRPKPPLVTGHPFIAFYRCTRSPDNSVLASGAIYRDTAGRLRTDTLLPNGIELGLIEDWTNASPPSASTNGWANAPGILLDLAGHTATEVGEISRLVRGWAFAGFFRTEKTRDTKLILGVECRRIEYKGKENSNKGYSWISEDLGIVLADVEVNSRWTTTWEIERIEFGEPLAAAFSVPVDFEVIEKID